MKLDQRAPWFDKELGESILIGSVRAGDAVILRAFSVNACLTEEQAAKIGYAMNTLGDDEWTKYLDDLRIEMNGGHAQKAICEKGEMDSTKIHIKGEFAPGGYYMTARKVDKGCARRQFVRWIFRGVALGTGRATVGVIGLCGIIIAVSWVATYLPVVFNIAVALLGVSLISLLAWGITDELRTKWRECLKDCTSEIICQERTNDQST